MGDPVAAFRRVIEAFERLGIPYIAGGSVASSIHGIARATTGVDLVADIRPDHAEALARELGRDFYADPVMIRDALSAGRPFNVLHMPSVFKFDIFPARDLFARTQIARREFVESSLLGGEPARFAVASAEDTVLAKLSWFKLGGGVSEQQWRDVLNVLRIRGDRLDRAYLDEWAPRLGVADLLAEAFRQAAETLNPSAPPRPQTPSS